MTKLPVAIEEAINNVAQANEKIKLLEEKIKKWSALKEAGEKELVNSLGFGVFVGKLNTCEIKKTITKGRKSCSWKAIAEETNAAVTIARDFYAAKYPEATKFLTRMGDKITKAYNGSLETNTKVGEDKEVVSVEVKPIQN